MIATLRLALILALSATPALSLSCLRPDVVRMYEDVRDSEDSYWIVRGRIQPLESVAYPMKGPDGNYPADARASTRVRLTGLGLTTDGTYTPFAKELTMTIGCTVVWCGTPPLDTEVCAAVTLTETGPEWVRNPCPWTAIPVEDGDEARLLACLRDGDCQLK